MRMSLGEIWPDDWTTTNTLAAIAIAVTLMLGIYNAVRAHFDRKEARDKDSRERQLTFCGQLRTTMTEIGEKAESLVTLVDRSLSLEPNHQTSMRQSYPDPFKTELRTLADLSETMRWRTKDVKGLHTDLQTLNERWSAVLAQESIANEIRSNRVTFNAQNRHFLERKDDLQMMFTEEQLAVLAEQSNIAQRLEDSDDKIAELAEAVRQQVPKLTTRMDSLRTGLNRIDRGEERP